MSATTFAAGAMRGRVLGAIGMTGLITGLALNVATDGTARDVGRGLALAGGSVLTLGILRNPTVLTRGNLRALDVAPIVAGEAHGFRQAWLGVSALGTLGFGTAAVVDAVR